MQNVTPVGVVGTTVAYDRQPMSQPNPNSEAFVDTLVLPTDELAARRNKKPPKIERGLSAEQVERLLKAAAERKKTL